MKSGKQKRPENQKPGGKKLQKPYFKIAGSFGYF